MRIATGAIGASLSLHAALALMMALRHAPAPAALPNRTIEMTTYVVPPTHATTPPVRLATSQRTRHTKVAPSPSAAPETTRAPEPSPSGAPASPSPSPSIDLFAREALGRVVGPPPASPSAAAPSGDERETLAARTRSWLDEAAARERASSGRVAPKWRALERTLQQAFHPPLAVVKQESAGKALVHRILRSWLDGEPRTGTVARGVDASNEIMLGTPPGLNIRDTPAQQAAAVQSRWSAPATSLSVEVEVVLDAAGAIVAARVVRPSGRRAFNRTALAAVRDAIAAGGAPDEGCTVVTRWLVDAAVAVQPPTSIGFHFDETGHLNPGAHGWRRYVSPTLPFNQQVQSHVSLVAIEPRR